MNRKKIVISAGVILALTSVAVWATNARVMWTPYRLAPTSIAPGDSPVQLSFSFTNKGPSTINGKKLAFRIDGDAKRLVGVSTVAFPQSIKKESIVTVPLTITIPATEPIGVVQGELLLLELKPNGSVKEIFSDALPISIVVSHNPLPPFPDPKENNATVEGIDISGPEGVPNGVRDDIDIYIGLTYPNSAKIREALKQEARALTPFLLDADDKAKTRANNLVENNAYPCLVHVMGRNLDLAEQADDELLVQYLNTRARSRAYNKADAQLGGFSSNSGPSSERFERDRLACSFDADSLPN